MTSHFSQPIVPPGLCDLVYAKGSSGKKGTLLIVSSDGVLRQIDAANETSQAEDIFQVANEAFTTISYCTTV